MSFADEQSRRRMEFLLINIVANIVGRETQLMVGETITVLPSTQWGSFDTYRNIDGEDAPVIGWDRAEELIRPFFLSSGPSRSTRVDVEMKEDASNSSSTVVSESSSFLQGMCFIEEPKEPAKDPNIEDASSDIFFFPHAGS